MAGFENYGADTGEIELEIERKGIVLGVDWSDEVQVRALAREALDHLQKDITIATPASWTTSCWPRSTCSVWPESC